MSASDWMDAGEQGKRKSTSPGATADEKESEAAVNAMMARQRRRDAYFNRAVVYAQLGADARALQDLAAASACAVGDGAADGDVGVLCFIGLVQVSVQDIRLNGVALRAL